MDRNDPHQFLKESGYLNSPTSRYFWRNTSPSFRDHVRQLLFMSSLCAFSFSLCLTLVTLLRGVDRLWILVFYFIIFGLGFLLLDLAMVLVIRFKFLRSFWSDNPILNGVPVFCCLFLIGVFGLLLKTAIASKPSEIQAVIWVLLALSSWLSGQCLHILWLERMYWHGVHLPVFRPLNALLVFTGVALVSFLVFSGSRGQPETLSVKSTVVPVVLLAFDAPEPVAKEMEARLPWPSKLLQADEPDLPTFWASLGSGTSPDHHRASLVQFRTPVFGDRLNLQDPVQRLPLKVFQWIGWAEPLTSFARYRKYFWEILDEYRVRVFSFSYWYSHPAVSRHGGVVSERWTREYDFPPYISGISSAQTDDALSGIDSNSLGPTVQRENQAWAQLLDKAETGDFDLMIAYFPLSDLLQGLEPSQSQVHQERLINFRERKLETLFGHLPEEARVGIFIASGGKAVGEKGIKFRLISNWQEAFGDDFGNHLQVAPSMLNYFGLPMGRFMAQPVPRLSLDFPDKKIDYGEPKRHWNANQKLDSRYYQELKSLGYIQ